MGTDAKKGRYTTPGGSKTWEYLAIFNCSIISLCIGAIVGWDSPSIVKLMASDSSIPVTVSNVSTLVAMVAIGHILGPIINRLIVDRIGRRKAIMFSGITSIVCWGLIAIATSIWVLYVARLMGGLCLGQFMCVFTMYIGEIASPSTRGAGGAASMIMFNLGILMMFTIAPYLSISTAAVIWLTVSIGFTIAFWFMPESPYYLVMTEKTDEAEAALEKLRGKMDVSEELRAIVTSISNEKQHQKTSSVRRLMTAHASRRAFIIINLITVTHQIGGFFMLIIYGQLLFKSAQLQMISEHTANIIIGVVQVASATITIFLVDKLGRKPLILFSGLTAATSNLVIGVFFYAKDYLDVDVSAYSGALLISAVLLVFAFNCGLLPMQMILMSEMFATEVKALATCLLATTSGCFAVIAAKAYILVAVTWNYGHSVPYLAFFVIVTVCTALILRLAPETKGKTFVQIQKELND
ncbi:facilitated trehalose transporter Tret1 [Monomorium pharaonis]|uniref:facilitated trehalose transporter Tret1 n=1 Tax=Monomorium pharaonis TaxID=307658 RepID=UPI00063ED50E|nr:facilitated trehalose transporter Tret1 [Monomorium pharaonis]XP_028047397.1 facilitated trehalose transporter Tret1 [Monomorium pharaonis]XP_036149709.1 facilitated trehalose transporter Tret1 [Monomorium pharaonis]